MDIICVDAKFDGNTLDIYKKYGVVIPKADKLYNIRGIFKHTIGKVGILLEEIVNPQVPFKHPILGDKWMEPTFNSERFRHLDGSSITREELTDLEKELQGNKISTHNATTY